MFTHADLLITEYERRFEASSAVLPALAFLPNSVVVTRWKDAADEWVNLVQEAIGFYEDLLP